MKQVNSKLDWVYIAKGIGIILVAIGHFDPADEPVLWRQVRLVIYEFHMPLFFILSGYLFDRAKYTYSALVSRKIKRLLYPFFAITLAFLILKVVAQQLVPIRYPVTIASLGDVVVNPAGSFVPIVWFIQALFLIFLVYPLLKKALRSDYVIMLLAIVANTLLGGYELPVLNKALFNLPFFVFGMVLRDNASAPTSGHRQLMYLAVTLVSFVCLTLSERVFTPLTLAVDISYLFAVLLGIVGALMVVQMSQLIRSSGPSTVRQLLTVVGFYSMSIYLFHTMFESAVRVLFFQLDILPPPPFVILAALAVSAGVFIPLLIEKSILRNTAITRKYLLGLN